MFILFGFSSIKRQNCHKYIPTQIDQYNIRKSNVTLIVVIIPVSQLKLFLKVLFDYNSCFIGEI